MCCYHSSIILLLGPLAEFTIHMLYGSFFFLNEYESYCIRILPFMKSFVNYNLPLKKYYILSFVEVQFPSWFSKADIKSAILHMLITFFFFLKKRKFGEEEDLCVGGKSVHFLPPRRHIEKESFLKAH